MTLDQIKELCREVVELSKSNDPDLDRLTELHYQIPEEILKLK